METHRFHLQAGKKKKLYVVVLDKSAMAKPNTTFVFITNSLGSLGVAGSRKDLFLCQTSDSVPMSPRHRCRVSKEDDLLAAVPEMAKLSSREYSSATIRR